MRTVLQKLLHPGMSQLIHERGYSQVGGSVVRAGDARNLRTADALRQAYGWPSDGSGHVTIRYDGVDPATALAAGLRGNQNDGWSALVSPDEIENVRVKTTRLPRVRE